MYFNNINITYHVLRVNLKMEKPRLCCFTLIIFIALNFTVASLLMRKTWDDQFAGKMGGWGILRNGWGGGAVTGAIILKWWC